MPLYLDEVQAGIDSVVKQADIFSAGAVNLFPSINTQQKWKYGKGDGQLHLHDGQRIYSFSMPDESREEDFEAHRHGDVSEEAFNALTNKGTAQVHRADPGSIYLTLHEGRENPTYTLKHIYGTSWRGIPKKKKAPKLADIQSAEVLASFKAALEKQAELKSMINNATHGMLGIGAGPWWANGLLGAGAGGLYHGLRQSLYNTPEENAEENSDPRTLLRRTLVPAAAMVGMGALQQNTFPKYYEQLEQGKKLDLLN